MKNEYVPFGGWAIVVGNETASDCDDPLTGEEKSPTDNVLRIADYLEKEE